MSRIDELLNTPYWIVDILPAQVAKGSPGQYFTIEDFFLHEQLAEIKRKHLNVILNGADQGCHGRRVRLYPGR